LIAKLASDFNKPNGLVTIAPSQVENFIQHIPVEKIWGVGKVTAKIMFDMGIRNCKDLQALTRSDLIYHFGKFGDTLFDFSRGIDERRVETEYERKSLGTEETFSKDITLFEEMKIQVIKLVNDLIYQLQNYEDRTIKNLHLKIKYLDFKQTTIERQLPLSIESFLALLEERWSQDPRAIRLLGVGVKFDHSKVEDQFQLPLLT
jgi:DNA polymerase-4